MIEQDQIILKFLTNSVKEIHTVMDNPEIAEKQSAVNDIYTKLICDSNLDFRSSYMSYVDRLEEVNSEEEEQVAMEKFNEFSQIEKQLIVKFMEILYYSAVAYREDDVEQKKKWFDKVRNELDNIII